MKTNSRPFFVFLKSSILGKRKRLYLGIPRLGYTIKTNCVKFQTVDPEICSKSCFPYTNAQLWWTLVNMLNFDFLETVLVLFSAPHFLHDFCMICAWTNLIALWKKELLWENKKQFRSFLNVFQWPEIAPDLRVGLEMYTYKNKKF